MSGKLLIVDDEESIRANLKRYFSRKAMDVLTASTGGEAVAICGATMVDVVLLDLRLPDLDGLAVLGQIKAISPQTSVILITAHGDVDTAVKAMQMRADNFLLKPVDLKAVEVLVAKLLETARTRTEILYLKAKVSSLSGLAGPLKPRFPARVTETIQALASSPTTSVLIQGETGTGKGVAARLIHELSERATKSFVDINCATLTPEFLESELFGHEKGAFTDAKDFKRGMLEVAHGGSLFLDEIGELAPSVQAKLLHVLEEKKFRRLGGTASIQVDARLIAATNADLERSVAAGTFRKDLFYRLNVMPIVLPPLRQRREEILPLAKDFLDEFVCAHTRKKARGLTAEAESALQSYAWPGNIRELRNVMERAALLCEGDAIGLEHLPESLTRKRKAVSIEGGENLSMEAVESDHIRKVLKLCEGSRSQAARLLGIHRSTLLQKIEKYGLDG
ncbi:MAG: sigma-54-dependent transcriptional regulator [Acidobacteriota bacterium]